ncbi:MAG: hypothetical protein MJZ61_08445 [Bacteroidales bacterium]|nr:hypothetical protein [Bacteroidales bacterium]
MALSAYAQDKADFPIGNPYLPLWEHLPDGEPRVFEDPDNPGKMRVYIIGSHDISANKYCGPDIHQWSAPVDDLSQWRDEGAIFSFQNPVNGKWDIMFAPDLVELNNNGNKEYYLYPHPRGWRRVGFCAKSSRPDGPFTIINAEKDQAGVKAKDGSVLDFDPSVFIDKVTNPKDPDYEKGYRVYGYWGFQHSSAAELDPDHMYAVRPGKKVVDPFIPASVAYGKIKDTVDKFPAIAKGEDLSTFNFFEASSIRKVGNKYVMVYSGYSGPDYGKRSSNSALRYAYGDSPLGPWKGGGVLVDSRAIVLNLDGSDLETTYAGHNTHGSLQQINGQWYVFYHRCPRGNGWARQAMVAPVKIVADQKAVAKGGKVKITGFDPYASDNVWTAKASNGNHYQGAEVTSEGFYIYGLPPYRYYSAGYACYLSDNTTQQDNRDIWTNDMPVTMKNSNIVGYKYFGFGGLDSDKLGLKAFEGTKPGNGTQINLFMKVKTKSTCKIHVMLDGPVDNQVWKGKEIAVINVPVSQPEMFRNSVVKVSADVSAAVDNLDKKHAIFLVAEGEPEAELLELYGIGFSDKNHECNRPSVPKVQVLINGKTIDMPKMPVPFTPENGYTDQSNYEINYKPSDGLLPRVSAKCDNKNVAITIKQASSFRDEATVTCNWNGMVKTYHVKFEGQEF